MSQSEGKYVLLILFVVGGISKDLWIIDYINNLVLSSFISFLLFGKEVLYVWLLT